MGEELGVLIIPKWLILTSGHIAILFGSFLDFPKCSPNLVPSHPLFIPKDFKKYKTNPRRSLNNIIIAYMDFQNVDICRKGGHRIMMKIRLIKFQNRIWDQYLSKSMNRFLLMWYQCLVQNIKWHLGCLFFCKFGINMLRPRGHQNKIVIYWFQNKSCSLGVLTKTECYDGGILIVFGNLKILKHEKYWTSDSVKT